MAVDASNLVLAGTGTISVAPIGTTMPTDAVAALDAGFLDLGYATEKAVSIKPSMDSKDWKAWQSNGYSVRTAIIGRQFDIEFELMEIKNASVLSFAFGGATYTTGTAGKWTLVPPAAGVVDERAIAIDMIDGTSSLRLVAPRAMLKATGDIQFSREDIAMVKCTVTALQPSTGNAWTLFGKNPVGP